MTLRCFLCLRKRLKLFIFLLLFIACVGFICSILCLFTDHTCENSKNREEEFERNIPKNQERTYNPKLIHSKNPGNEFDHQADISILNNRQTAADDPRLVALIRDYFVIPPSDRPYHLDSFDCLDQSQGQAPFIDNRLRYKEKGFYVESGAYDGETMSNTLMLERFRRWNGVLIEPNPTAFELLKQKQREAYMINACLSTEPYPSEKMLTDESLQSRIFPNGSQNSSEKVFRVQCFPLYSILLALNVTKVDYLSLDMEGGEHGVLETIPWHKVQIQMLSIEYDKWPGGSRSLCKYMNYKGYECLLTMSGNFVSDALFRRKSTRWHGRNGRPRTRRHKIHY